MDIHTHKHTNIKQEAGGWRGSDVVEELPALIGNASAYYGDV